MNIQIIIKSGKLIKPRIKNIDHVMFKKIYLCKHEVLTPMPI